MAVEQTAIQQVGDITSNPLQKYGDGQTILRIG
jgi:hypothetical protein